MIESAKYELEKNIEIEKAITDIKTLSGLLPICALCKKIVVMLESN